MGTTFTLVVEAESRSRALAAAEAAVRAVEDTAARLSTWRAGSELSALNRAQPGEPRPLSRETAAEIVAALACRRLTGGAFDPAIGPVLDAWAVREGGKFPEPGELAAARARAAGSRLEIDELGTGRWIGAAGRLEEGGFGKGAGLDRAAAALLATVPPARAWMSLGGQVLAVGGGSPWEVAVAHPLQREKPALRLRLEAGSLATSGNSERGLEVAGERLGHLFDPRTGRPAPNFGSLTVLAADALTADCLSTGLYVLGPDAALTWAAGHPGVEVLTLEPRGERVLARLTPGLAGAVVALAAGVDVVFVHQIAASRPLAGEPDGSPR